jgi:hypothetical protein
MKDKYFRQWMIRAPLGLILIGFGACLVAEAAMAKYGGASVAYWVAYGTFSLVVFNAGLCVFGDAILQRARYERAKEKEVSSEQDV